MSALGGLGDGYVMQLPSSREIRDMRVRDVMAKAVSGQITWSEAERILGYSARHVRRLRQRFKLDDPASVRDRRAGRPMPKRIEDETIKEIVHLRQTRYFDFNLVHFHQMLGERHNIRASYTYVKNLLQGTGLAERAKARGKHRRRRERRPMVGMMLHMDGSTHAWLGPDAGTRDLVVMLDDADGRVLFGQFFEQEGTRSCLTAIQHVLEQHGLFSELYVDKGSHFVFTPKAGESEPGHTQIERVLKGLRIRMINAHSPQARGRMERHYRTDQGRLPQELREAGIRDWDAANRYLNEHYWPRFNRTFTVEPHNPGAAFMPLVGIDVRRACALEHEVTVAPNNCVRWSHRTWQIPAHPSRPSFAKCKAVLVEYLDGSVDIEYGPQTIARFDTEGEPAEQAPVRRRATPSASLG
jgi:hypothetical protein